MVSNENLFEITKLREVLEEVLEVHNHEFHGRIVISEKDPTLETFIKRIVSLKQSELKKTAILMDVQEQLMLTQYIPHNYFNVDMENLYSIYKYIVSDMLSEVMYKEWQDAYDDRQCNKFLAELCIYEEIFIDSCNKLGLESKNYVRFLCSEDIPSEICMYLKELDEKEKTFDQKLHSLGIEDNTTLFDACEYSFYMYCNVEEYQAVSGQELNAIVVRYAKNRLHLKAFLKNFLTCFKLSELRKYDAILPTILNVIGERNSSKYSAFFADFDKRLYEKFDDWVIQTQIYRYLGNERGRFWTKYKFVNIVTKYINKFKMVILESEEHVVIEFLEMGYAYFFEKERFWSDVAKRISFGYTETELKYFLNHNSNYDERKKHNPGWEYSFSNFIYFNDIVERLEDY